MSKAARVFSVEFKAAAVARILAGERVALIAVELGVRPKLLYEWRNVVRAGGTLRLKGRPSGWPPREAQAAGAPGLGGGAALARIAELERKIGRQQMDLVFFRVALQQVGERRRPKTGPGATASTPSSKR